ncbi:MAG: orotidine-5'-phosphate decarboxylase [Acidimicrobiales bacterium]|nr:orotidine-5'-phosphate decarboxylase [Acidimicrobiales bacterium]
MSEADEEVLDAEADLIAEEGEVPAEIRDRLALALDVDDIVAARRLAFDLEPFFGTLKVGLELFTGAGPDAVSGFAAAGFDVFCDLKLHDIPTTVGRAARVVGSLGARWLTVHTQGGDEMLRAAVEGVAAGAEGVGLEPPGILGVTVLTSDASADRADLESRTALAAEAGCAGIICAATDLEATAPWADRLVRVVPGTRLPGGETHDQARVTTPREAIEGGADLLVVGRAVTAADEPILAAAELVGHLLG